MGFLCFYQLPIAARWTENKACWPSEVFLILSPHLSISIHREKVSACFITPTTPPALPSGLGQVASPNMEADKALRDRPLRNFDCHESDLLTSVTPAWKHSASSAVASR